MEQYTSEDARREWRRILNKVDHGEQVGITRYGEAAAVVVPVEWHDEAAAALTAKKTSRKKNWHDGWTDLGRDGDGNLILRYEPTGGLYRILPVEE